METSVEFLASHFPSIFTIATYEVISIIITFTGILQASMEN